MAARVVDLEIVDVEGLAYYRFRWSGDRGDWFGALEELKRSVPVEWRQFDEESKLWMVEAAFHDDLVAIFPNFERYIEAARTQAALFEEPKAPVQINPEEDGHADREAAGNRSEESDA